MWGENDPIFLPDGARAYLRDVPEAELHFFDTGHFALEDKADKMIPVMRDFLARNLIR
ncbi:alpha/beta fold hydrolase [Rhizobium leguminosarum]|uniref:alpha/beta fold hydrolase n=1 Tax=Rhizobium leguminosarum TaxID=384 RepID=UPI0036F20245